MYASKEIRFDRFDFLPFFRAGKYPNCVHGKYFIACGFLFLSAVLFFGKKKDIWSED